MAPNSLLLLKLRNTILNYYKISHTDLNAQNSRLPNSKIWVTQQLQNLTIDQALEGVSTRS